MRRRLLVGGGVAVAVVLAGGAVWARSGGASGYRTATVSTQAIADELERVGTIEPVSQATVGFPVSGTVATVDVAVGDTVEVGQTLASLDTAELDAALVDQQAALDQAELTLERARNGETSGGSGGAGGDGSSESAAGAVDGSTGAVSYVQASVSGSARAAEVTEEQLAAAQQAVLDAKSQVDTDIATAQQALDDAATVCAAVGDDAATATDTSGSSSTSPTSSTSTTSPSDPIGACQTALQAVQDAQATVSDSQAALNEAAAAYDELLAQWAGELADDAASGGSDGGASQPGGTSDPGGDQPGGSGGSGGAGGQSDDAGPAGGTEPSGETGGGSDTTSYPSAEQLIAYQQAVDAAAAQVTVAEQALAQATVVSPIAGTVQTVGIEVGDSVSAGDTTTAVVVAGDGGYEVSTTVTVDQLPDVEVGQEVAVTLDGSDDELTGEVVSSGVTGTTSGSTTTYPVVVSLTEQPADELRNGATASLAIVTDDAGDVLAIPTSAVTVEGDRASVTVLDGGEPSEVDVEVGAVGDTWTEITGGLEAGQEVVLADLDEPLPGSATDSDSGTQLGPRGPGGAVAFPAGAGPPGDGPPGG